MTSSPTQTAQFSATRWTRWQKTVNIQAALFWHTNLSLRNQILWELKASEFKVLDADFHINKFQVFKLDVQTIFKEG